MRMSKNICLEIHYLNKFLYLSKPKNVTRNMMWSGLNSLRIGMLQCENNRLLRPVYTERLRLRFSV